MSFEDMMKQLRQDYIENLPAKIEEIQTRLDATHIEQLREDFHKLKGTGKTYGFPEISQLAEVVEDICITRPDRAVEAAAEATKVLTSIYRQRQAQQCPDLLKDETFHKIRQFAA